LPELKLFLLGYPRVELDGSTVELDTRKTLALLAYLAIEAKLFSREALATLLWPDYEPKSAYHNLRRSLWTLNKKLGKEWLQADRYSVRLNPEAGVWVDTDAFLKHIQKGDRHEHPGDELCPECLLHLSAAVDLYRGGFMEGFTLPDSPAFDEWQFFVREDLENHAARALEKLAGYHEDSREWVIAIEFARRWLALDVLNEPAHRLLMRLYARSDQRPAALRQYEICVQTLQKELGVAPQPETTELYEQIQAKEIKPPDERRPAAREPESLPQESPGFLATNLPEALTPFVGRRQELGEIGKLIGDPGVRLLTLLGPGGTGKTRLAIEVVREKSHLFPDGTLFIPLAPLSSAEYLLSTIAKSLRFNVRESSGSLLTQLGVYLHPKEILLILDNFEQLITAQSIEELLKLLEQAPHLKLLVTSRARLDLKSETLFLVKGMRFPDADLTRTGLREMEKYSALQLFLQCARKVRPDFRLTNENLDAVTRICKAVQGMPLGIELATAWMELLSLEEIVAEIQNNLDFLETTQRDVPERQRSTRAVFSASWKLLNPSERDLFKRLSIFRGSFSRQAAGEVAHAGLRELSGLVSKSFLYSLGNGRFVVHELLRQYGVEELQQDGEEWQAARVRHSAYHLSLSAERARDLFGPKYPEALEALDAEIENLRAAWDWAVEQSQFERIDQALFGLFAYFTTRSLYWEFAARMQKTAQVVESSLMAAPQEASRRLLLAKILPLISATTYDLVTDARLQLVLRSLDLVNELGAERQMGVMFSYLAREYGDRRDPQEAIGMLRRHLDWLRASDDDLAVTLTLQFLGSLLIRVGQPAQAKPVLEEAIAICKRRGDRIGQANSNALLADLLRFRWKDAFTEVERVLLECIEIYESIGARLSAALVLLQLAQFSDGFGEFAKCIACCQKGRQVAMEFGWLDLAAVWLSWESIAHLRMGDLERARQLRQQSLEMARETNSRTDMIWGLLEMGEIERVAGNLDLAEKFYQECITSYQDNPMTMVMGFYHKSMGDLSLSRGEFESARQHFEESRAYARRDYSLWCAAYATSGLGRATLAMGEPALAHQHFMDALRESKDLAAPSLTASSLSGMVRWFAASGDNERAIELGVLVMRLPATWQETRDQVSQIVIEAASRLPAERAAAAQEHGRNKDLDTALDEILEPDD
jgi:predicted ATPase/DNA-binding SARP family transcriptional activator/tetratricopeptide (TPR) repeat protein